MDQSNHLRAAVRDVHDFPKPGIVFKDITPILSDSALFQDSIKLLAETAGDATVDKVVGIDARGFIFAAAVADRLNAGFIPIRKKGKLPSTTREAAYELEYGEAIVEIHEDAIKPGENVLLIDDLLATGGTAEAAGKLIETSGGIVAGFIFVINLYDLPGNNLLKEKGYFTKSLIEFPGH